MRDTRYIVAEQAQRILNGGTPTADNEATIEELVLYVDQCFGKLIKQNYFENKIEGDAVINGSFIYSFVEDVKTDAVRDKYYVNLSSTYVNLPNNVGIFSVSPTKDEFNTYVPINVQNIPLAYGLDVAQLEGRKGYYIEATRLYLYNIKTTDCPEKLLVKLVGGIQDNLDPNVDMPLDMQAELVNLVVQTYREEVLNRKDITNDNIK